MSVEHIQKHAFQKTLSLKVRNLNPKLRFYPFFDGVDVTGYMTPKVIEITKSSSADPNTNETPFVVGETVIGQTSKCQTKSCS